MPKLNKEKAQRTEALGEAQEHNYISAAVSDAPDEVWWEHLAEGVRIDRRLKELKINSFNVGGTRA